jgi:hypothetical protein
MKPLMKCGHAANATRSDGKEVCVICFGINDGYDQVADAPDLTGRTAKCAYLTCKSRQPSSTDLAFFEHKPEKAEDVYYCGCRGWD